MRPRSALTLALAAVGVEACFCPPTTYSDQTFEYSLAQNEDGTLEDPFGGEPIDPTADCEAPCEDLLVGEYLVSAVTSCAFNLPDDPELPASLVCEVQVADVCVGGRHHADLVTRARGTGADAMAAWLAREAHGEAGSITAFRRLARELEAHGAPPELVAAARQAAADEVRHAAAVSRLARARGGRVERVAARAARPRPLVELARENAVEGCVHETWAAAQAAYQAATAADPEVRAVAAALAPDEVAHAELAWALHRWALSRLAPDEARQVEAARRAAWRRLIQRPPVAPGPVRQALGLPDEAVARRLAVGIAGRVGDWGPRPA
jgi:rubrerythrin